MDVLIAAERVTLLLTFLIGFWLIVFDPNLVKKVFGLSLLNSAVVLLFVLEGSRIGDNTPILEQGIQNVVDPLPQALMLTAIVIGVCVTAFSLALVKHLYRAVGSFDIRLIRRKIHDET